MTTEEQEVRPQARKICAWCGKDLGPSPTRENSHGICPDCAEEYLQQAQRDQRRRDKNG